MESRGMNLARLGQIFDQSFRGSWDSVRSVSGALFQRKPRASPNSSFVPYAAPLGSVDNEPPDQWVWHVHPDGMPYFFKEYPLCNVVTQDDVMDATIRRDLELNITSLFSQLQLPSPDHDYELWLTLDEKNHECFDHIFMDHTAKEVFCYPSSGEIVKEGECSYWKYFSKAPMHHTLPNGVEDEMMLHLIQFSAERVIENLQTTAPFTLTQSNDLISVYKTLKEGIPDSQERPWDTGVRKWLVSLVMFEVCNSRSVHSKNTLASEVRPSNTLVSGGYHEWYRRIMLWILRIACFDMHERYRRTLIYAHENGGIKVTTFQKLLAGTLQEWTDSNLLSTVFVSANMAFLAVPSITTAQQTLILVSSYFSIASVMIGVHHLWTHRPKVEADADETIPYLHRAARDGSRITSTSVFLCLPIVFLLWAVLAFFVALLHYAFKNYAGASRIFLACITSATAITGLCVVAFFYWIWRDPSVIETRTKPSQPKQTSTHAVV